MNNKTRYAEMPEEQNESASARPADEFASPWWKQMSPEREASLIARGFVRARISTKRYCLRERRNVPDKIVDGWVRNGQEYPSDRAALTALYLLEREDKR